MYCSAEICIRVRREKRRHWLATSGLAGIALVMGGAASAADLAINGGNTQTVTADATYGSILLGDGTGSGTLILNSGNLSATDNGINVKVGDSGAGTMTVNGGSLTGDRIAVGFNANGNVTQTAGTVTANLVYIGGNSGALDGSYSMSGGALNINAGGQSLWVGKGGNSAFTISGGTATIAAAAGIVMGNTATSGTVNLNGGTIATTQVQSTGGTTTFNFNGGTLQAGATTTTFMQGLSTAQVRDGGARIDTNGNTITIAQNLLHSSIGGDAATDGGLRKSGTGTLILTGTNTYTGRTIILDGTLNLGSAGAIGSTGQILMVNGTLQYSAANQTDYSARFSNSANQSFNIDTNSQTVTFATGITAAGATLTKSGLGTLILTGANTYSGTTTVSAGTLQIGNGTTTGTLGSGNVVNNAVLAFNRSDTLTVSNNISGTGSLAQNGTGSLVLSGANSYTGNTVISSGIVSVSSNGNLGGAGSNIQLAGGTLQTTGSFSTGRTVDLQANSSIFTNAATTLTVSGVVSGAGALTKAGAGALVLSGNNSYTGNSVISNGTLSVSSNANLGGAASNIQLAGGTLQTTATFSTLRTISLLADSTISTDAATTLVVDGVVSNSGKLTKAGAGTLVLTAVLTGANTYSGGTTISAGTLQIGVGGATGTLGSGNVVNNAALVFNRADAITVANAISGTGSLTQNGADALTLTGALTYSGTTTVGRGSIILGDATNSVTLPGNASVTGGNLAVANGSLGSGTITVANGQSVVVGLTAGLNATAGSATINSDGTTSFQNAGSAGTSVINSTGLLDFADTSTAASATISLTGGAIGQLRDSASGGSATFTVGVGSSLTLGGASTLSTARVVLNAGTLNISTHNLGNVVAGSVEGNGDIGLGGNTLEAGGNNRSTTYSGVMSGTGGLEKKGTGNFILSGTNSYTGNTNVSGGTLSVNGSIASSAVVFVNNGGTLGGNGTVATTIVGNGGAIGPGNSIGTLTVNGDVTFNNGSTYSVEVNSAGAADKLVVNGTATINADATLAVRPFNVGETGVTYGATTTYTILTATGGVNGRFSNVTDTFAFLDATATYAANSVTLTLKRNDTAFPSVGNTPNQRAAAAGVNSLGAGTIYGAILGLSAPDARAAFDLLSGEIHASVETVLVEDSRLAREAVNSRMVALRRGAADASRHVWLQGFGAYGTWASDGNAAKLERSTGGFLIGSDGEAFDNVSAGLFAGYGRTALNASARASGATIDTYQVGAYGGTSVGDLAFRFMSAYSFHDIGTSRSVGFTGFSDTLSGRYQAGTGQVFGEVSYDFKPADGTVVSPFANLAYVRLDSRGFREAGGAAALSSGADFANTLFSTVGVSGRTTIDTGSLPIELSGRVGWRHAGGNVGMDRTLNFANGAAFTVGGVPVGRDTALIDAEFAIKFAPASALSLRYSGQIGSGVSDHSFNARYDVRF